MTLPAALILVAMLAVTSVAPTVPAPVVFPRPPFAYFYQGAKPPAPRAKLVKVSERRNRITDVDRWFQSNNIQWPALEGDRLARGDRGRLPPAIPGEFAGNRLVRAIISPPLVLAIYGKDFADGRYVIGFDSVHQSITFAFDFKNYVVPPAFVSADRAFVDEPVQWALVAGGILYVSNFHRTYARSSRGLNGYITAIDLASAKVLWRTRPLVANAANFIVAGDVIITGYGFTAEPDFLYLLNRASGAVVQTARLRSGPEYLALRQNTILVRTYDTDTVFRLVR